MVWWPLQVVMYQHQQDYWALPHWQWCLSQLFEHLSWHVNMRMDLLWGFAFSNHVSALDQPIERDNEAGSELSVMCRNMESAAHMTAQGQPLIS